MDCNDRNPMLFLYQASGKHRDRADNHSRVSLEPFIETFVRGANTGDNQSLEKYRKALSRIEQRRVIGKLLILLPRADRNEIQTVFPGKFLEKGVCEKGNIMTAATKMNAKPDKRVDVTIATQCRDQYVHYKPTYENCG
jgi:hypothetical protein